MFNLMSKDKPKIVDSVITQRHSDHGRLFIEPKTDAVDLCGTQRLDNHIPDTTLGENTWNLSGLLSADSKRSNFATASRTASCEYLGTIISCAISRTRNNHASWAGVVGFPTSDFFGECKNSISSMEAAPKNLVRAASTFGMSRTLSTSGSQPRFIISETGNSPNNRARVARPGSGRETISALAKSYFRWSFRNFSGRSSNTSPSMIAISASTGRLPAMRRLIPVWSTPRMMARTC